MVLHKEYRKPECIKKAAIVLKWNVHLKLLKVIFDTQIHNGTNK